MRLCSLARDSRLLLRWWRRILLFFFLAVALVFLIYLFGHLCDLSCFFYHFHYFFTDFFTLDSNFSHPEQPDRCDVQGMASIGLCYKRYDRKSFVSNSESDCGWRELD